MTRLYYVAEPPRTECVCHRFCLPSLSLPLTSPFFQKSGLGTHRNLCVIILPRWQAEGLSASKVSPPIPFRPCQPARPQTGNSIDGLLIRLLGMQWSRVNLSACVCVCVEKQRSGKSRKPSRRGKLSRSVTSLHLYQSPLFQRKTLSVRFGRARGHRKRSITVMKAHELFTLRWKFTPGYHSIYKPPSFSPLQVRVTIVQKFTCD